MTREGIEIRKDRRAKFKVLLLSFRNREEFRETRWMTKEGEKMKSGAGYENNLHSDPWSSAPGLLYKTFHRGGEGDTVHGKTKKKKKKK